MDQYATYILIGLAVLNILTAKYMQGWAYTALISILNISIATTALFTAIYADIYFAPYIQLIVLFVAIMSLVAGMRINK